MPIEYWLFSQTKTTGQLPERGEVQRLVERALVHRAIAEERDGDALFLLILDGEAETGGDGELGADDGLAADEVVLGAVHVHRAALALAAPRRLAQQLGHDDARLHTFQDGVAVLAVAADDVILRAQRGDDAHAAGLLPDVEVQEAADPAERVFLGGLVLEATDQRHLVVHVEQLLACQPAEGDLPYGHVSCLLTRPYWATPCRCFPHCLLPNDAVMTSCVARCYKRGRLWAGFRLAYLDRSDRRHEKARPLHGSRAASLGLPEHISGGVVATPWIANGFRMRTSRVRLACASPTVPYKPAVRLLPRVIPALAVRRGSRR